MVENINPNPSPLLVRFPDSGKGVAAPAHFPYRHRSLAEVDLAEQRGARERGQREAARAMIAGRCTLCKGRSPEWKVGKCPALGNTGASR